MVRSHSWTAERIEDVVEDRAMLIYNWDGPSKHLALYENANSQLPPILGGNLFSIILRGTLIVYMKSILWEFEFTSMIRAEHSSFHRTRQFFEGASHHFSGRFCPSHRKQLYCSLHSVKCHGARKFRTINFTENTVNSQVRRISGSVLSTMSISFVNRFNIRPIGVVSNIDIGQCSTLANRPLCIALAACTKPSDIVIVDDKVKSTGNARRIYIILFR